MKAFPFGLLAAALLLAPSSAPGFGQNKVQYSSFTWSYIQTRHFDIYYPQGGDVIATFAARHVEEMYRKVSDVMGHRLTDRVPIILHSSHVEFQQTNVIRLPLHEGIGGFTEVFKNRVVLPFEGSYPEFYRVLQHELVHAVMFNLLFGEGAGKAVSRQMGAQLPLWLSEGLAEYATLGWDLGSEFFMIDATTFGYVAPPTMDFGGFLAYKGGQLFLHFLESTYGKGTVTRFVKAAVDSRDLAQAFQKVTRTSLEEAGEIWLRELRFLYWPELGQRQYGKTVARKLTDHGKDRSFYNLQPSLSPNGEEIAFFSDRQSWEAIYILNVKTEKVSRTVIQGGKAGEHESFHSFKSGIAWSPDGKQLAIVSKQGGRDVIHLIDAKKGKVKRVLRPDVQAILSPAWSRDGRLIAFSGQDRGFSDIYVIDLQSGKTRRLTNDIAHDDKPAFSPSGKWIAFESDRPGPQMPASDDPLDLFDSLNRFKDIYRITPEGEGLERIAGGTWDEKMPTYGASDSLLIFVSNRSGLDNLYLLRDSAGVRETRALSNLLTGCFTPSWSYDGSKLAFSLFEAGGWDIFLMRNPLSQKPGELPKTRFIRNSEDTTLGFFRPLNWANLSSYKPDTGSAGDKKKGKGGDKGAEKDKAGDSTAAFAAAPAAGARDTTAAGSDSAARDSAMAGGQAPDSTATAATAVPLPDSASQAAAAPPADSAAAKTRADSAADGKLAQAGDKKAEKRRPTPFLEDSSRYLNPEGDFIRRPYKPVWSLDAFNAALGVDTYYGTSGLAFITLSDLMGDQSVSFALSMNGSFENTNGFVLYEYLPYKPDFTALAFHEAQQGFRVGSQGIFAETALDRRYGGGLGVRYPFSPFVRVEAEVLARFTRRTTERFDAQGNRDSVQPPPIEINALLPTLAWVRDNAQWGIVGPVSGHRMMALAQVVPPVFQDSFSYVKADVDLRWYWEYFKRYTLALRLTGGASEALGGYRNPHSFIVGGEAYTFNARWNDKNASEATLAQFYFSDLDFPLRGYHYYEFVGNRKFLGNLEFRYPFVRELTFVWPLPFSIRHVMGNVFVDYGGAWSRGNAFRQMGLGLGFGMRLNLGIFVLKYTYAESVQGVAGPEHNLGPVQYWSLGAEF